MRKSLNGDEIISVAFCVDAGFVPHLGVALTSLFLSNANRRMNIYIATDGISEVNKSRLEAVAATFGRSLVFLKVDLEKISHLRQYFQPTATYYRLLLPYLLPDDEKVIYLDSDMVIESDLAELWETKVDDVGCAAFPEPEYHQAWMVPKYGIQGDLYVNAGVLVMNLTYWRANDLSDKCIKWLQENEQLAVMMDQDAINKILYKKKKFLDRKWNLNPIHGPVSELLKKYPDRIIHFAGSIKPWHKWYDFSLQKIYFKYLDLTPWRSEVEIKEPLKEGQCLSVANQYFQMGDHREACQYYQRAIDFRLKQRKLDNILELRVINCAHRAFNVHSYQDAADLYRACFEYWGYPIEHNDIYKIPGISGS